MPDARDAAPSCRDAVDADDFTMLLMLFFARLR